MTASAFLLTMIFCGGKILALGGKLSYHHNYHHYHHKKGGIGLFNSMTGYDNKILIKSINKGLFYDREKQAITAYFLTIHFW